MADGGAALAGPGGGAGQHSRPLPPPPCSRRGAAAWEAAAAEAETQGAGAGLPPWLRQAGPGPLCPALTRQACCGGRWQPTGRCCSSSPSLGGAAAAVAEPGCSSSSRRCGAPLLLEALNAARALGAPARPRMVVAGARACGASLRSALAAAHPSPSSSSGPLAGSVRLRCCYRRSSCRSSSSSSSSSSRRLRTAKRGRRSRGRR